jgi:hypothetical protein
LVKAANHAFGKITMKPIHVIGAVLVVAFAMAWCFQIWSGQWKTGLQREGNGSFYENKRTNANVENFAREASNDGPNPANPAIDVSSSESSWVDRVQNLIGNSVRAIKGAGNRIFHRSRPAPPGVYFTLTYLSVRTRSGITGVGAGTRVVCVKDEGPVLLVKAGDLEFDVKRQYLTDDLDVADLAVRDDAEAQQTIASYIAQQQQAIDKRDDRKKIQPSGEY